MMFGNSSWKKKISSIDGRQWSNLHWRKGKLTRLVNNVRTLIARAIQHGTWSEELGEIVSDLCGIGDEFTIRQVYEYEDYFSSLYPRNSHVRPKLRQVMQDLRDHGMVEFVDDDGRYKRVV